jgi:hypothetical protein
MPNQEPTIASILRTLAHEYDGPVEERRLLDQVLERRPSAAKNPYATIRDRLRWDGLALGWLRLSRRELMPLRMALSGLRFRCVPRSCDIETGMLPVAHLHPFAGLRDDDLCLIDDAGTSFPFVDQDPANSGGTTTHSPSFGLSGWYTRTGFVTGDSILVKVLDPERPTLQIEHEPAAKAQLTDTSAQDTELLEAIITRVGRAPSSLIPCDEIILPIFAAASWRADYPGQPWQYLVTRDSRLELVDDIFLTNQHHPSFRLFSSDEVFAPLPMPEGERRAADLALFDEIEALQRELRDSREQDADAGLWNGQIQRASAAYSTFDSYNDELYPRGRSISSLERYDDLDDDDDLGVGSLDEEMFSANDEFARLQAAHDELMAALPPEIIEQLEVARPEEAEVLIASQLNMLLAKKPHLFPVLDLSANNVEDGVDPITESLFDANIWQEEIDDDDWGELDDDLLDADITISGASTESSDLIGQFYDYLFELGKSGATVRARSRDIQIYAEFLASYYNRSLAGGDYATLDECLFYYYPRRIQNTSPRQIREICTSLKQFYKFMRERGVIVDDRFAQALWRRRDQAARVVEIYDRISNDSPNFQQLFARLFQPYTE